MKLEVNVTLSNVETVNKARENVLSKINDLGDALRDLSAAIYGMGVEITQPTEEPPTE